MVQLAQAAEYALKGVQTTRSGSHERTHDLNALANAVGAPSTYHSTLSSLKQAYATRYPDEGRFCVTDYDDHRHAT